jgi:hypothetical protein
VCRMVPSVSTTMALECKPANGPSSISRPLVLPKFPELKSDKLITFSSPSAPQNVFEQR